MIFFLIHKVTMGFAVIGVINGVLMQVGLGFWNQLWESIFVSIPTFLPVGALLVLLLVLILRGFFAHFDIIVERFEWDSDAKWTLSKISIADTSNL